MARTWCLGNSHKLLTINKFLVSAMFFTIMNISFFNLLFVLFLSLQKKSIKSGTMLSQLLLSLFSSFAVHSLQAAAMLFNIFS